MLPQAVAHLTMAAMAMALIRLPGAMCMEGYDIAIGACWVY